MAVITLLYILAGHRLNMVQYLYSWFTNHHKQFNNIAEGVCNTVKYWTADSLFHFNIALKKLTLKNKTLTF